MSHRPAPAKRRMSARRLLGMALCAALGLAVLWVALNLFVRWVTLD